MLQDTRSCRQKISEHGSTMTLMPHHYMGVSLCQLEVPNLSPHQHLITPLACFVISSPPKDSIRPLYVRRHQRLHQCLAEDIAYALLLAPLCCSHPYSLKCRSLAQNPPQEP
jgi:hypothetical protein